MNDEALAPKKWSYYHSYEEGPTEDVWATCSLTWSSSLSGTVTSTINTEAPSLFPIIECPPLLRYLLAHQVKVERPHSPAVAVEAMLDRWRLSTIFDPECPTDTIKRCLRLLSGTAVAAATNSKIVHGFPTQSNDHMICLSTCRQMTQPTQARRVWVLGWKWCARWGVFECSPDDGKWTRVR
jgi:hypothetical protein